MLVVTVTSDSTVWQNGPRNEHGEHDDLLILTSPASPVPLCEHMQMPSIKLKGAALNNCWGFVDGTVRPNYRPLQNRRIVYNGHKRVNALRFQSIVTPNGLIANLYGPVGE